jgi:hypothetical protein
MADDKSKRGGADRKRININEPYEVRYWSQKFGCTHAGLGAAVHAVGDSVAAVERYLKGEH